MRARIQRELDGAVATERLEPPPSPPLKIACRATDPSSPHEEKKMKMTADIGQTSVTLSPDRSSYDTKMIEKLTVKVSKKATIFFR